MSGSPVPVRRIDASPQVTRWRAERARQEARRRHDRRRPDRMAPDDGPGRRRGYAWPADRQAIIAVTVAAGRGRLLD